jgi:hypothetical protein
MGKAKKQAGAGPPGLTGRCEKVDGSCRSIIPLIKWPLHA